MEVSKTSPHLVNNALWPVLRLLERFANNLLVSQAKAVWAR